MKNILFIMIAVLLTMQSMAQQEKSKAKFYILTQVSFLNGDHASSWQGMITGGLNKKTWSVGIGAALDLYKTRTLPLFIDIRKEVGNKKIPLFAYMDIGSDINFPALSEKKYYPNNFDNGLYSEFGLGYTVYRKKHTSLLLSIGYSEKTVIDKYLTQTYNDPGYQLVVTERKLDYHLNRFVFKLGWRLW